MLMVMSLICNYGWRSPDKTQDVPFHEPVAYQGRACLIKTTLLYTQGVMMIVANRLLAALFLSAIAVSAQAGNAAQADTGRDTSGVYFDVGAGLGIQACDYCGKDVYGFGAKLAAGWRFNRNFAIEAGVAGASGSWDTEWAYPMDRADETTGSVFGAVVGILPLNDEWEVFGRVGVSSNRSSSTTRNGIELQSHRDTSTLFGAGFGYTKPGSDITWRVEYNQISTDQSGELNGDGIVGPDGLGVMSVGAVIQF